MAAFVGLPLPTLHALQRMPTCCSAALQPEWDRARAVAAASVAAVLVAAGTALCPQPVLSEDAPLVFDHDQSLVGADFSNRSDLRGSIFSKANCNRANFEGSDLTNAQLDDGNFIEANLRNVRAVNASATKTKFMHADLSNVDFSMANLIGAQFDAATIIDGADFTDSLIDRATQVKLCARASGVNATTGVSTAESLMCPE